MIYIFSEIDDPSTNYIIDWLLHYKQDFKRDNGLDSIDSPFNMNNKFYFELTECFKSPNIKIANSIWYRRPSFDNFNYNLERVSALSKEIPKDVFKNNLRLHNLIFKKIFLKNIENESKIIGNSDIVGLNKIFVLNEALKLGLNIPRTIVTNSITELNCFIEKEKNIIVKPLFEVVGFFKSNYSYISLTTLLDKNSISPVNFSVSLFQTYIEKEYEIRVFIIDNILYSMAIFSQRNDQTKVDFRDYDDSYMNKMVPYNLNKKDSTKLKKLIQKFNLNTGSIDLIKSTDGKIYFLEINPVGQFDFLSKNCNYHLEKIIAKNLLNE